MSDTYEINRFDEVVPYISGRRSNDTRAYRNATELEIQQRDRIEELEKEVEHLTSVIENIRRTYDA